MTSVCVRACVRARGIGPQNDPLNLIKHSTLVHLSSALATSWPTQYTAPQGHMLSKHAE